ncbi:SDR family NAD(P)-dependent oxidoreductase [Nocardioides sp.]|uniref:SDR family NAD(P)-dependent oxidoreductase n=1 Tax=Nocardioides sp. TaxID=35761 RepID=UPI0039E3A91B
MKLDSISALVTGGASGLGLATVRRLRAAGARVGIVDLNAPSEELLAELGEGVVFAQADIADEASVTGALDAVEAANGPLRAAVHCAGRGGDRVRILDRDGNPGALDTFAEVVRVNLVGTYNVLRLAAARIARSEPVDGERGAIVLTASVAAFDGQIGQTSYTAAKAGVHGITLVAARDLASRQIRVNTIAPGVFDTPMLARLRPDIRQALEATVPHPSRLGSPDDYAHLAITLLENSYVNGETIRLDGAIRMAPR